MFVGNRKTKIYLLTITGIALTIAIGFFLSNLKCKKIIEDNIFLGIEDGILEKRENIKKIEIPDGVTDIGDRVFYNCTNLENITIPETVKTVVNMLAIYFSDTQVKV